MATRPAPPEAGARAGKQRGALCGVARRSSLRLGTGSGPGGAMEGGSNSKGSGLGGLFGAGGMGYSHADLAGVPREYRRGLRRRPPAALAAGIGGRQFPLTVSEARPDL